MRQISLGPSHTAFALVDDEHYERLAQFNWTLNGRGYAMRYRNITMHREVIGAPPGASVDHINFDKLDNRRSNLRLSDAYEQMRQLRVVRPMRNKLPDTPASPYRGVSYERGKKRSPWRAALYVNGKKIYLGRHRTAEEAARAYDAGVRTHLGERWWVNVPAAPSPEGAA